MTPTTERQQFAEQNEMSLDFVNWFFDEKKDGCGNMWFLMAAALWEGWKGRANWEAQPVAYLNKFSGVCMTLEQQPNAAHDAAVYVPLYLAPPAPAVNTAPDFEAWFNSPEAGLRVVNFHIQHELQMKAWEACRAAMLAQPVSGGYKLASGCQWTYDEMDFKWDSSCGESWQFIDGGPSENGVKFCQGCGKPVLLAAEPEGGNG